MINQLPHLIIEEFYDAELKLFNSQKYLAYQLMKLIY